MGHDTPHSEPAANNGDPWVTRRSTAFGDLQVQHLRHWGIFYGKCVEQKSVGGERGGVARGRGWLARAPASSMGRSGLTPSADQP